MLTIYVKRLCMSIENSLKTTGRTNLRIHRDITGEMLFGRINSNFKGGVNNEGRLS